MKKLNWFETKSRQCFHILWCLLQTIPVLFLKLISGRLWAHHQRNRAPLPLIPTWLLKQCQDQLSPVLTTIVNTSLSCAELPTELKKAFLFHLIKKIIFDCEIFRNYRPVSNLSFISKFVERVVCVQLASENQQLVWDISVCLQTTLQHRHSFVYKMTYSKPLTMREEPF